MGAKTKSPDDLLTTAQVASDRGVDRKTVTRWCADGDLPHIRIGRDYLVRRGDAVEFSPVSRGRPKKVENISAT